jgi:hypothetical protein
MAMKPNNPHAGWRPGTMLGNLKAWEKDMETEAKKPSKENRFSFNVPDKVPVPELKGRFSRPSPKLGKFK